MRLKFYVPNNVLDYIDRDDVYINPVNWLLKAYHKLNSPHHNDVTWLEPMLGHMEPLDDMLQDIKSNNLDLLALGLNVGTSAHLYKLAAMAKENDPNLKIVIGGPDVDAHLNPDFFVNHPYVDYVVYGDGEEAFTHIIDSIIENRPMENAVNVVTADKKFPLKVFGDREFLKISPWLMFADEVKRAVDKEGSGNSWICWEMARGCAYSCSFCDWNSGLHHKVKRRKVDWKSEIDFFMSLDIKGVYVIDANWGMFDEDVEIHAYGEGRDKIWKTRNYAKLHKDNVFKIMDITYKYDENYTFNIGLQDINDEVLLNVDRPEIPWQEHKEKLIEFASSHPNVKLRAQFMVGLPGQTVDSWIKTLDEVDDTGFRSIQTFLWHMLPMSPAAGEAYIKKHGLIIRDMVHLLVDFDSEEQLNEAIQQERKGWYKCPTVIGTDTLSLSDLLLMNGLGRLLVMLKNKQNRFKVKKLLPKMKEFLKPICQEQANLIEQTGVIATRRKGKIYHQELMFDYDDVNAFLSSIK